MFGVVLSTARELSWSTVKMQFIQPLATNIRNPSTVQQNFIIHSLSFLNDPFDEPLSKIISKGSIAFSFFPKKSKSSKYA